MPRWFTVRGQRLHRVAACVVLTLAATGLTASGQVAAATAPAATTQSQPAMPLSGTPALPGAFVHPEHRAVDFWPPVEGPALTWFAVVIILALTLRLKPLWSERNLDGLMLAATCLLLVLRADTSLCPAPRWAGAHTGQWWSFLLLSLAAGYWLLRGMRVIFAQAIVRHEGNVSKNALFILVLAGLAIGIQHIAGDPLSAGARDGLVGGVYTAETGKLPYGEASGYDGRSPLLYLLEAGAARLDPPTTAMVDGEPRVPMVWANRDVWLARSWFEDGDFASARLVNGLLFILFVLALYAIGACLHSSEIGLTLVAITCIFPGAVECFSRPEIMLPATLFAWSAALAFLPGLGGLLSMLLIVVAGTAWPWAWLALPVLLAYFFRHGWQSVGGLVGTLAGIALSLAGVTWLTRPALPQPAGALARAEMPPAYAVGRSEDGSTLMITPRQPGPPGEHGWLHSLWQALLNRENLVLDTTDDLPGRSAVRLEQIDPRKLLYRQLDPDAKSREELTQRYRTAVALQPAATRMWVALRTTLEQTWARPPRAAETVPGTWSIWAGTEPLPGNRWPMAHKIAQLLAGALALLAALVVLRVAHPRPHRLFGGLLVVCSAALLVNQSGAANNLVWLMPALLALWAVHEPAQEVATPAERPELVPNLPPRITVER